MKEIESIKSKLIRDISLFLLEKGHSITFCGNAWSDLNVNWIYFDTILDLQLLVNQFDYENKLETHENTDPKSGLEKGLVDPSTGEAIMGLVR
jgi:hypothetical protein